VNADGLTATNKKMRIDLAELIEKIKFDAASRVSGKSPYATVNGKTGSYRLDNEGQGSKNTKALFRIQKNIKGRSPTYAAVQMLIGKNYGQEFIKAAFNRSLDEFRRIILD